MRVLVTSARPYDKTFLTQANSGRHDLVFIESSLNPSTARLAGGFEAVCCFVEDRLDSSTLKVLSGFGVRLITLRAAGFNNVDLEEAKASGLRVMRVKSYTPEAVAEFAVAMILTLNRKTHRAFNRVRESNFLLDGLLGWTLRGKTAGIAGTGAIGTALARILAGFGMRLLGYDLVQNPEAIKLGLEYVQLERLFKESDVLSLHLPLRPKTRHTINERTLSFMKPDAMLINTSRGGLVDTKALIAALKRKRLGAVGLDVYEEEEGLFYRDHSLDAIDDDFMARLLTFPNALITGHQAFFTEEALKEIAQKTIGNLDDFERGQANENTLV